jgi:predicted dehydrogenase
VFDSFDRALFEFKPDVLIIATEPGLHMAYAIPAALRGLHCFIEASVVEGERIAQLAEIVKLSGVVVVPSCTMHYFPGPTAVRNLLSMGKIGKPLNINYLTGQYLPDWHPWEDIRDYYVSKRETGGAREIVSFELTWLNEIFGDPEPLACVKTKITDMDADIYHCILRYPGNLLANCTIEVVSRPKATRELHVIGSEGRLVFSGDENCVRYFAVGQKDWTRINLGVGTIEAGYINPEEPYISEMMDFVKAVSERDRQIFPNTLEKDVGVLALLNNLERLSVK